ncbi:hypothetical protein DHEL01_v208697 [Diaporthe helianthi]|uniref:Uncharacterized protein n=1 Tax=Diaporthe helianthi TaxID=158607 RepID=A0A2P5HRQ2_DIAHE|nr:hypothetical protein DHEL01_v208697 [Diaporthe helianthi]
MTSEEIKDTIVVAWPPKPQVDGDETAVTKTTTVKTTPTLIIAAPTAIGTSATPSPPRQIKRPPMRVCGFCRPYLGPNGVCGHVREHQNFA